MKQLSNRITSSNPTWQCPGNLKAKIGDHQMLFRPTLKYYFQVFQRNFKVDCMFNNLTLILASFDVPMALRTANGFRQSQPAIDLTS